MDFLHPVLPALTGREEGEEPLFGMPLSSSFCFRLRTWAEYQRWLEHSYSLPDFAGCWKGSTEHPSEEEQ